MKKKWVQRIVIISCIVVFFGVGVVLFFCFNKTKTETEKKICILNFNVNGGTPINSLKLECGSKIDEPVTPSKEGFEFIGWYINEENVNFDHLYLSENLSLEAKWKAKENIEIVVVKFNTGADKIKDIELAKGTKLIPPLNPKKEGYVFKYWSYNGKRFNFMTDITEDIELEAVWEKEIQKNTSSLNEPTDNSNNNNNNTNHSSDSSITSDNTEENNPKMCTYQIKSIEEEYDGKIPEWGVSLDAESSFNPFYGFNEYDYDTCDITYKTLDPSVLTISSTGVAVGKKLGSTYLDICVVDKESKKELDCFRWNISVHYDYSSERSKKDSLALANALVGYYWYLDGYEYAYIKVDKDFMLHDYLEWYSKYMDLENDKFITTEDTGIVYTDSTNIFNTFGTNPESASSFIEQYGMHVSSDKLYITLGGKTYSFTKRTSAKKVKAILSVDKTKRTIGKKETVDIDVNVAPFYAEYHFDVSYNPYVIHSCDIQGKRVSCYAQNEGSTIITITDSNGSEVQVEVTVHTVAVSGVSLNKRSLDLISGEKETLVASVFPAHAEDQKVIWTTNNPDVAKVDEDGTVTAYYEGTAVITATTEDGAFIDQCSVNVTSAPLQARAEISLTIRALSNSVSKGIKVNVIATGGTGEYTYFIKLYSASGQLLWENGGSNELIALGYTTGSYYAEFGVYDSKGNWYTGKTEVVSIS